MDNEELNRNEKTNQQPMSMVQKKIAIMNLVRKREKHLNNKPVLADNSNQNINSKMTSEDVEKIDTKKTLLQSKNKLAAICSILFILSIIGFTTVQSLKDTMEDFAYNFFSIITILIFSCCLFVLIKWFINSLATKQKLIIFSVITLILLFTNPSLKDFKENGHNKGHREWNFLICSIYTENHTSYFGILKNFF